MDIRERQQRYLQKVLENELERVRLAGQGERNGVLFKAAATLAGFVASGAFSEEEIRTVLDDAGTACGLERSEIRATIRSGFKAGYGKPREIAFEGGEGWSTLHLDVPASPPPPPRYPPLEEVRVLWNDCTRLGSLDPHHPILNYLADRALDGKLLDHLDLLRVLPPKKYLPTWCPPQNYRLVVPTYDATGALRSLRFRAVGDPGIGPDGQKRPKAYPPWGFEQRGLVMADGPAKTLLLGSQRHGEASWDGRVVIAEGEPDWWSWATRGHFGVHPPKKNYAVFGIVAGSWSPSIALRIPDGATVIIRTDQNPAGDRYARTIYETLSHRCTIKRPQSAAYGTNT